MKITEILQVAPTASDEGQLFDCEKSATAVPVSAMLLIVSTSVPELESTIVCEELAVLGVVLKVRLAGVRVT